MLEKSQVEADSKKKRIGRARTIGKYTDAKHFRLATCKDMVPMVYPTSMAAEPVIY